MPNAIKIFLVFVLALTHSPSMVFSQELDRRLFKPSTMVSIESSKKELKNIYLVGAHNKTFHCGCMFDKQLQVYPSICDFVQEGARPGKNRRIVKWIHGVPISVFAASLNCWKTPLCSRPGGKKEAGAGCCGELSPRFKSMQADMHNLFPSVEKSAEEEIVTHQDLFGGGWEYSVCTEENKVVSEPREGVRGDIARVWFYMSIKYRIPISEELENRLRMWHLADPPDSWEEERNSSIEIVQGNRNPFIDQPELAERVRDF